jgi:hypothetical protein
MPQYLMLIYQPVPPPPGAYTPESLARWDAYTEALRDAGMYIGGNALQSTQTATTLREHDGEVQVIDGPFAETKEVLAGYYLVESSDLDEVLDHAKRMPNIGYGSVEVRPVMEYGS